MSTGFTDDHKDALEQLLGVVSEKCLLVVGATAVGLHLAADWRATQDLDLSVTLPVDSYTSTLEELGWKRLHGSPHFWLSPRGLPVDIIPATPAAVEEGGFTWPDGSAWISLVGFRMAFAHAVPVPLREQRVVHVASLPALVVLKIVAYGDRPAQRGRDLEDIAHIIEQHLADDAAERWEPDIIDRQIDHDDVGAFLIGRDIGRQADERERSAVDAFLDTALDDSDSALLATLSARGPAAWRRDAEIVARRLRAFRLGMTSP